jgi:hypothetical protein
MCTQYLQHIYLPSPFPHLLYLPTGTNSYRQDLFHTPVLQFYVRKEEKEEEKKKTFFVKIPTQEVFLWHFMFICIIN